jgi:hypothetical protein
VHDWNLLTGYRRGIATLPIVAFDRAHNGYVPCQLLHSPSLRKMKIEMLTALNA